MVQWHNDTRVQCHIGTAVQWYRGDVVRKYSGMGKRGIEVQRDSDTVLPAIQIFSLYNIYCR